MDLQAHEERVVTAAVVLIGNELLSGRTQDVNLQVIAQRLNSVGVRLVEARVIADVESTIIETINTLRQQVDYLFTTGGIGPTHDDITSASIAKAFGRPFLRHPEAERRLTAYFEQRGVDANSPSMRMADMPDGVTLIDNPVSVAPGYQIDNVFVMAGVPAIMQAMIENVLPMLQGGKLVHSETVVCDLTEGKVATGLANIQARYLELDIGSYPGRSGRAYRVALVIRGTDQDKIAAAAEEIRGLVTSLSGTLLAE